MQHGKSSGLDIFISIYGGCWLVQGDNRTSIELPEFPLGLINTGEPESSTGECVAHTEPLLNDERCQTFTAVTQQMQQALNNNDLDNMHRAIRTNHQLLCELGVVPNTIASFVNAIEATGASAKICGAGSIKGNAAGALMILEPEKAQDVIKASAYTLSPLSFTQQGVQLV
jgi:hydroxymethylglutaryl-CoA synthase